MEKSRKTHRRFYLVTVCFSRVFQVCFRILLNYKWTSSRPKWVSFLVEMLFSATRDVGVVHIRNCVCSSCYHRFNTLWCTVAPLKDTQRLDKSLPSYKSMQANLTLAFFTLLWHQRHWLLQTLSINPPFHCREILTCERKWWGRWSLKLSCLRQVFMW